MINGTLGNNEQSQKIKNNFMKLDRHQLKEKSKNNKMKQSEKSTLRSLQKRKAKDYDEKAGR